MLKFIVRKQMEFAKKHPFLTTLFAVSAAGAAKSYPFLSSVERRRQRLAAAPGPGAPMEHLAAASGPGAPIGERAEAPPAPFNPTFAKKADKEDLVAFINSIIRKLDALQGFIFGAGGVGISFTQIKRSLWTMVSEIKKLPKGEYEKGEIGEDIKKRYFAREIEESSLL